MTTFQKIVKYLALALAIALIIGIITLVAEIITMFDDSSSKDLQEIVLEETEFNNIDVDIEACSLDIKNSDKFQIFTDSNDVNCKIENDTLIIKEKEKSIFRHDEKSIVIYLPTDFSANEVSITGGAGRINVEYLSCQELDFEIGAGSVTFSQLFVSESAKISGGVGSFDIKSGKIQSFDIELGVGSADITAQIFNADIEAGIGDLILNLEGSANDYTIRSEAGIGDIIIDNSRIEGNATTGNGDRIIKISGGISSITVNFTHE